MMGLVERLREEALWLSGRSIDRGCVDSGIAANLAEEAADEIERLRRERDEVTARTAAEAEIARYREALTPSRDTKAAYIGEFEFYDKVFEHTCFVPWPTIKEIMAAISRRAALEPKP